MHKKFAGLIRNELGRKMNLIDNNKLELCIINDFPMFEFDEQTKKWEFCHNPFSLPHGGIKDYEEKIQEKYLHINLTLYVMVMKWLLEQLEIMI